MNVKSGLIFVMSIAMLAMLAGGLNFGGNVCAKPSLKENTGIPQEKHKACKSICVLLADAPTSLTNRIRNILIERITERCPVEMVPYGHAADLTILLSMKPGIGAEGFRITDEGKGRIEITGNDPRGLLFGAGKFLRTSGYGTRGFEPGAWRGVAVPDKPVRGIYFATHFHNWYHVAPLQEITRYVEDLALWGTNSFSVWFDMHHYHGINDPAAQAMLGRLRTVLKRVKDLGLDVSLTTLANEGYANSPAELRADFTAGHDGYFMAPPMYHVEICPNKPGAKELELKWAMERFEAFRQVGVDSVWLWPYDQGGCTCARCAPWGSNGFLSIAEPLARAYKRRDPKVKIILSTWYFDNQIKGEWEGITNKFNAARPEWVDYIMADQYGGRYPQYPLQHGSPGGLPMLNFPEISMYQHTPWGGYGANPTPEYLQGMWDVCKDKLSGGFPYSEGLYEDINKAICAQFYWDRNKRAIETVREYIAFYYSPTVVEPVSQAIAILERNLERQREDKEGVTRILMKRTAGAAVAFGLIKEADRRLLKSERASWRWRVLYLRALIDAELVSHQFRISQRCQSAFEELNKIYHDTAQSLDAINPPNRMMGIVAEQP